MELIESVQHLIEAIKKKLANKSDVGHTHKYAASSSAGGAATSIAVQAGTTNADRYVYFADATTSGNASAKSGTVLYSPNFVYNPNTKTLTVENIAGKASSATVADSVNEVAWGNVSSKPTSFTPSAHNHAAGDITSGTLAVARGGTGQTSLVNSCNSLINGLTTGSSTPQDADYYISQYVGGGTTTTTFHRRPHSALWAYIKSKADGVYSASSHTHSQYLTSHQDISGKANLSGATFTGNVTAPKFITSSGIELY